MNFSWSLVAFDEEPSHIPCAIQKSNAYIQTTVISKDWNSQFFDFFEKHMNTFLVSDVIHKAVIEVNEEGSEAAAVTAVIVQSRSASRRRSIKFDRPFFFILQDKKHCLKLFVGRVVDPSGNNQLENSPIQKDSTGWCKKKFQNLLPITLKWSILQSNLRLKVKITFQEL